MTETLVDVTITLSSKKGGSIEFKKNAKKKPWKQLRVTLSGALVASIGVLIVLWGCKIVN